MTNKLKCPFCGEEIKIAGERTTIMSCFNGECYGSGLYGEEAMWKALIDGKKAQDALKVARNLYQELALAYCEMADDYSTTYGRLKTPEQEAQEYMQEYDEKIASITKDTDNDLGTVD